MTELILHGYIVAVLPRTGRSPEIVLRAPGGGVAWLDAHTLDVLIAKLERELEVMRAARGMLVGGGDVEQIGQGNPKPLAVKEIQ